jgi:endoglucanase
MPPVAVRFAFAVAAIAGALAVSSDAAAQSMPFPTSGHYAQGFVPPAATSAAVQSSYANWKTTYLLTDCGSGYYRVDNGTGDSSTFSEGQGYGMVLTAYFGDKTAFDGLWSFAKKNYNAQNLMGWHVTCSGFTTSDGGSGSATDGDTDIGFGLLVAAVQWGGSYLQEALTYLATLKSVDFTTCSPSGRNVATAGSWQGNQACTTSGGGSNTSYWMPAYYRVFATLTGDSFWSQTADDVVTLYGLAADPTTGIIVNEVDQDGVAVSGQTYDYNSCRIPWRATLDYLWYGTPAVQTAMTKLTTWANSVGIQDIVDGYNANGTHSAAGMYTGLNAFVGGFTVGAMTDTQAIANSFATYFVSIADDNGGYYGASLRTLYLFALSGYQWNPVDALADGGTSGAPPGADAAVTSGGDASSTGSGSSGSGDGGGGTTGTTGAAPVGDASSDASGGEEGGSKSSGGCGCRVTGPKDEGAGLPLLALAAGLAVAARRRRSRGAARLGSR